MYICRHVQYLLFLCRISVKLEFSRQTSLKHLNIKFNEYPSNGTELFHANRLKDGHTWLSKVKGHPITGHEGP
jgi:hypothetical protein